MSRSAPEACADPAAVFNPGAPISRLLEFGFPREEADEQVWAFQDGGKWHTNSKSLLAAMDKGWKQVPISEVLKDPCYCVDLYGTLFHTEVSGLHDDISSLHYAALATSLRQPAAGLTLVSSAQVSLGRRLEAGSSNAQTKAILEFLSGFAGSLSSDLAATLSGPANLAYCKSLAAVIYAANTCMNASPGDSSIADAPFLKEAAVASFVAERVDLADPLAGGPAEFADVLLTHLSYNYSELNVDKLSFGAVKAIAGGGAALLGPASLEAAFRAGLRAEHAALAEHAAKVAFDLAAAEGNYLVPYKVALPAFYPNPIAKGLSASLGRELVAPFDRSRAALLLLPPALAAFSPLASRTNSARADWRAALCTVGAVFVPSSTDPRIVELAGRYFDAGQGKTTVGQAFKSAEATFFRPPRSM